MSLKIFHIFFILLSIVLSAICAAWSFVNQTALPFGIASAIAGIALVIYGIWFLKKARKIIT
jgi:uncharacterized membrane protein SirB2